MIYECAVFPITKRILNKKDKEFEGQIHLKKTEIELQGENFKIANQMTSIFIELEKVKSNLRFSNIGLIIEALRKFINLLN